MLIQENYFRKVKKDKQFLIKNMENKENNKGYVYILTNRSFREDWVKIGKSLREVDVRSKELDNTAVPLPFEIFATLKTSKYNNVEKNLHKIFTDLADARIRKGREFFNITPERALDYLKDQAEIIDDAELNIPDDIEVEKTNRKKTVYKGKYKVNTDEIFYFAKDTTDARMRVVDGNKYIVLSGSRIDPNIYSNKNTVIKLREENADNLDDGTTIADIEFSSPSTAGEFVGGGATNGKYYWRTKNDKKLADFIEYIK